jgi:hypothetical protein
LDEPGDPRQRLDVTVVSDAQVARGDPAVAGDGRGLDHHQRHPAARPAAEVDQVPVAGQPSSATNWHTEDLTIQLPNVIPGSSAG